MVVRVGPGGNEAGANFLLGGGAIAPTDAKPPGAELGAQAQHVGGPNGWAAFVDEQERVPKLAWPSSIQTYHDMRGDSQVDALHVGTVQPVREFRWSIDPNSAPASLVERLSADMGLPIRGHEDDAIERGPRSFDFDAFLDDCLLAPLYGFFHFEIVGEVQGDGWHMVKLAPRHPRLTMQFQTTDVGDLLGIRQWIGGAKGWNRLPPPIPESKLVPFIWRQEAGSQVGRSLLRSIYREWLVKDRVIRVGAINIERGGGVPVVYGAQGASDDQLRDLAKMARQFKSAEGGGGALPFGTKLQLEGSSVPDAVAFLQYCDECMARVWALMLVQLGTTATGNRALGGEFANYAARAQRAFAKWVCRGVNRFFDRYVGWNDDSATHAPLLHYEQARPDSLSLAELVALIEAKAITVDPELEAWVRNEHGLPAYTPPTDPSLGDLTPDEVALVQNSRNPPALPAPGDSTAPSPPQLAPGTSDPTFNSQTEAAAGDGLELRVALPDRPLHRQANTNEIAAAIDFRAMDAQHSDTLASIEALFRHQLIPEQITAMGDQIVTTQAGTTRKVLTKAAMAALRAPVIGKAELQTYLAAAARLGAQGALAELETQGLAGVALPDDAALSALVADQADAVASMAANGISLAAQRRATAFVGGGRTPADVRAAVESGLHDLKHDWTMRQLNGAVQFAQNVGRAAVFASTDQGAIRYYASEILDIACCSPCTAVDGTEYPDLQAAQQDYAAGGFVDCAGGPNCRGTLVAVYAEPTGSGSAAPETVEVGA